MKMEFRIIKDRPQINVIVTRDSVCAGDDCEDHKKIMKIPSFVDPEVLARETASGYLPNVDGTGHSWTCILNDIKIAEIKSTGIQTLVREASFVESNRIHFEYKSAQC